MELAKTRALTNNLINYFFLLVLNLVIISITGYLTLDSNANLNSRLGAFLLSFFIPFFIVILTKNMQGYERMLKFGFGMIIYIIAAMIIVGIPESFSTGLLPCLIISLGVLFYGNRIAKKQIIS